MCPIAGNLDLGRSFIEGIRPVLLRPRNRKEVIQSIDALRQAAVRQGSGGAEPGLNVKIGVGGIRDVEFLVQGLQLIHGPDEPRLLQANTLRALEALEDAGLLTAEVGQQLREDYLYLRRVEHCLQILEDRQTHALPREPAELEALARRLYGPGGEASRFLQELEACSGRVRNAYVTYLLNSVRN
jgi:glutamate-ammonia-ligase adenylyltransferase